MEKEQRNEKEKIKPGLLIQFFIGGIIGIVFGASAIIGGWTFSTLVLVIIFIFVSVFVHINIHEFGHLIFGKLLGYRLISFRVGMFAWGNENGRMKLSIIKNKGYGGLCAMIPPEKPVFNYQNALYYAGGIILNIVTSAVFICLALIFPDINGSVKLFFYVLGVAGLVIGLMNFLPFISHNNATDGKLIWSIILKKPYAKKLMDINKMSSQVAAGVRPRDLDITLQPDFSSSQAIDILVGLYTYFKALDNNDLEGMVHFIGCFEENIGKLPHHSLPSVYYELCFVSCINGNEDKAREYYQKAGAILHRDKDVNGLRIKAYYEYYINKDSETAARLCEDALAVADKFPFKGQGMMERDVVRNLVETIKGERTLDLGKNEENEVG